MADIKMPVVKSSNAKRRASSRPVSNPIFLKSFVAWIPQHKDTIGLVIAVVTMVVTLLSWQVNQQNSDTGKQTFLLAKKADRPWLSVSVMPNVQLKDGVPVVTSFQILNSGKSPARIVSSDCALSIWSQLPKTLIYSEGGEASRGIVPPGGTVWVHDSAKRFAQQSIDKVSTGECKLYAHSKLIYEDIRTGEQYNTDFCAYWDKNQGCFIMTYEHNNAN